MESRNLKIENGSSINSQSSTIKNLSSTINPPSSGILRTQPCPICSTEMGDMPGSRDAYCPNCGYKDPCCE